MVGSSSGILTLALRLRSIADCAGKGAVNTYGSIDIVMLQWHC